MEVFEDPEPCADVGILRNHAAAFVDEVFDVFAECVFSGGDAFHGDDGESGLADDLHEGPLHAVDVFAVMMESRELIGSDAVRGRFTGCEFSVDEEVCTGGEEVGAADKAEVFCDAVEGVSFLVGYSEICMLSHFYFVG